MFEVKNVVVKAAEQKTGTTKGKDWCKHTYELMGVEGKFSKFVSPGTPLYLEGTVFKTIAFETTQYGNDVKEWIVQSVPKPSTTKPSGTGAGVTSSGQFSKEKEKAKDHPIWFCTRQCTDLKVALIASGKQNASETVAQCGEEVAIAAYIMYKTLKNEMSGKSASPTKSTKVTKVQPVVEEPPLQEEMPQEPDLAPDIPQDDIPF